MPPKARINRRTFMKTAGSGLLLAGAAAGFTSSLSAYANHPHESSKGVLVLGEGLAGLAAAYELDKAGVYFAGEHTQTATMNGAIMSGVRTSKEIMGK